LPRYAGNTRPNPFYGRVTTSISDAESEYKSATVSIRRRLHDGFHYAAQVSWSEDEDNDSNERNFAGIQAEDVNNLDLNWGPSARDQEWRIGVSGLWTTPWWGIELAGAFRYATGVPWNIGAGSDVNNDTNVSNGQPDRPTINGVHVGRNSERQPDTFSLDLRLAKTFAIKAVDLSIFAECFNCTDEANQVVPSNNFVWGNPNLPAPSGSGAATFGKDTGINVLIPPRTFQFGLRIDID